MRPGVDYYALLGVSRSVTPDELKRVYRQLVRQHHPDVADDGGGAQDRFVAIVEAYNTLSDPARRRAYDALRVGTESRPVTQQTQVLRQIDDWFRHALHRVEADDLNGAAAQCRKILALDPNHAAAHALLGDVAARRDDWDQALLHYSTAVTAAPRNPQYARKLRDAAEAGQAKRAAVERRAESARRRERAREALIGRHALTPYTLIIGLTWIPALLVWALGSGAATSRWLPLGYPQLVVALGGGFAGGAVLGLGRAAGRESGGLGWLAWLMGLLCLISFWFGLAFYCISAVVRGRAARPLSEAFGVSLALVAAAALIAYHSPGGGASACWPVVLWGGNIVFPACLIGYRLGRAAQRRP